MDAFIGEIRAFGFNFVPRGWVRCDGSLLAIRQYTALFSILGTQYGGDGTTTFAVPMLGGSAMIGQGQGPGLSSYVVGEASGSEAVTLTLPEIPLHSHAVQGKVLTGNPSVMNNVPSSATYLSRLLTSTGGGQAGYAKAPLTLPTVMSPQVIGPTGNAQPHENRQPLLVLTMCICLEGVFPSRS